MIHLRGNMKASSGYAVAAVLGVALFVLGGFGGYALGKSSRSCEVTVKGQKVPCDTIELTNELNVTSLERANKEIVNAGTVMRAMYEDLRATKLALADANAVIIADDRVINAYSDDEIAVLPSAIGSASQALATATEAGRAMHEADRTYAVSVKANPLTVNQ
jgi:hypothetical protein